MPDPMFGCKEEYKWSNGTSVLIINNQNSWGMSFGSFLTKSHSEVNFYLRDYVPSSNTWSMIIGVASENHNTSTWLGDDKEVYGWGYVTGIGLKNHNSGTGTNYSNVRCKKGDRIRMVYDKVGGKLKYFVNGTDLGVAFNGISCPNGRLRIAMSCALTKLELVIEGSRK